uniref:C2H2-type domain-containing protein n=1 Tax=Clastoptera arizonana TaxID=38151 RepID=A0A1B6D9T5_9HEMI
MSSSFAGSAFETLIKSEKIVEDLIDNSSTGQNQSKNLRKSFKVANNFEGYFKCRQENTGIKKLKCLDCKIIFEDHTSLYEHLFKHITQPRVILPEYQDLSTGKNWEDKSKGKNQNPLKITLKKLPTAEFQVVHRKKKSDKFFAVGRQYSITDSEENISSGIGGSSPSPAATPPILNPPSPTPSEFLRPAGLLAPEDSVPSPTSNNDLTTPMSDYLSSPPELTKEDLDNSLPTTDHDDVGSNEEDNEMDGQVNEHSIQDETSRNMKKNEFANFEDSVSQSSVPSASPIGRTLTILAPSQVNNNAVANGSVLAEQTENNAVTEAFNVLRNIGNMEGSNEVREGVSVVSAAKLYNNAGNMMDMNSSNDGLGMLHNFMEQPQSNGMEYVPLDRLGGEICEVCDERAIDSDALEQHKISRGHFKCHLSPDCAIVLFNSASELNIHQQNTHGVMSNPPPVQQLAQQVQRLPVPYSGMNTPPQSVSPASSSLYRVPTAGLMNYPQQTSPAPFNNMGTPPYQGMPDRSFVMLSNGPNTSLNPHLSISPALQISQQQIQLPAVSPGGTRIGKRPGSVGSAESIPTKRRNEDPDCSLVSVQQQEMPQIPSLPQLPGGITLSRRGSTQPILTGSQQQAARKDTDSMTDKLAIRGITITPTANKGGGAQQISSQNGPRRNTPTVQVAPVQPASLKLGSSISITPASQTGRPNQQFAVPGVPGRNVMRQPVTTRLPTVDLTQDTPIRNRNRPKRFTCQVCDKTFQTQDILNQHMATHRSPSKLPFKCSLCTAQYPTHQALQNHNNHFHKEGSEMALPVVDLKQQGVVQKLSSLGIRHAIPLSQLTNQSDGTFGIPIIAIDNARNPAVANLGRLGASNVLSIGPLQPIGR